MKWSKVDGGHWVSKAGEVFESASGWFFPYTRTDVGLVGLIGPSCGAYMTLSGAKRRVERGVAE